MPESKRPSTRYLAALIKLAREENLRSLSVGDIYITLRPLPAPAPAAATLEDPAGVPHSFPTSRQELDAAIAAQLGTSRNG